jgi:hypothetical protein
MLTPLPIVGLGDGGRRITKKSTVLAARRRFCPRIFFDVLVRNAAGGLFDRRAANPRTLDCEDSLPNPPVLRDRLAARGQHDPATFTGRASGGKPLEHLSHHQNQHFQLSFYHQTPSPPLFPCIPPPPRRAANPPRNTGFTKAIHEEHRELANHLGLHPRLYVKPVI